MKNRVKIDVSILFFIIVFTGLLCRFPQLYVGGISANYFLNFVGIIVILLGTCLRMSARGYKKANSKEGQSLVVGGPYTFVRNPMYLGTLSIGAGFLLIIWPWWLLPVFIGIFYLRFRQQIIKEENHLGKLFGKKFQDYCQSVPRLFPTLKSFRQAKLNDVFILKVAWTTKEKWGLVGWPLLAVIFRILQRNIVIDFRDASRTMLTFILGIIVFAIMMWNLTRRKSR